VCCCSAQLCAQRRLSFTCLLYTSLVFQIVFKGAANRLLMYECGWFE
jgi:hypothetical protein